MGYSDPVTTRQVTAETRYSASPAPTPPDEGGGNNPEGTYIKIVKNEKGTNTPLEGAVFELVDPHGHLMGSRSTDVNGVILWTLTEAGNYTLTEVNAPNGYKNIRKPHTKRQCRIRRNNNRHGGQRKNTAIF